MERFRVISDLHLDLNRKYPIKVKKDDVFTVIAGDTCGSPYIIEATGGLKEALKLENYCKFIDFVGKKSGKVEFVYSKTENSWMYGDKRVVEHDSGLVINKMTSKTIVPPSYKNGDKVVFSIFNVEKWIRRTIDRGVIIAGNHIVYNNGKKPIEQIKTDIFNTFPPTDGISFLDECTGFMAKEVDGILFVGSTLYTNYEYQTNDWRYGTPRTKEEMLDFNLRIAMPKMSGGGMNDFVFGRTIEGTYKKNPWDSEVYAEDGVSEIYWLTSRNYLNYFKRTFDMLKRIVEENNDKDIVVVTHHCPSAKCISPSYLDSSINASYISELDEFIKEHKNIKCWCCGHVHHRDSFKIGQCLVVMNPLGYCKDNHYRGASCDCWSFNTFVNTKTWELEKEPFDVSAWDRTYEKDRQKFLKWYKKYGMCFM